MQKLAVCIINITSKSCDPIKNLKKKEKIKRKNATKISREKFLGFVFEHAQLSAA